MEKILENKEKEDVVNALKGLQVLLEELQYARAVVEASWLITAEDATVDNFEDRHNALVDRQREYGAFMDGVRSRLSEFKLSTDESK